MQISTQCENQSFYLIVSVNRIIIILQSDHNDTYTEPIN